MDVGQSGPDFATDPIVLRYRETSADYILATVQAGQRTGSTYWIGLGFLLLGFGNVYAGDVIPAILGAIAGLAFIAGLLHGLFAWWQARSLPFPSDSEIVIDQSGIDEKTPRIAAHMDWTAFGPVFETPQMVFLHRGTALAWIPRRAFSEDQLEQFRRLAKDHGLLRRRSPFRLAVRLLAAVVVALLYVFAFLSLRG